jgi:glutaredoxin
MKKLFITIVILLVVQTISSQNSINISKNFEFTSKISDKGITLFTLTDCIRCETTKKYFKANHIKYKLINTSKDHDSNVSMWKLISLDNPLKMSVKFPVILVNGKINYDLKNLDSFLKKLK